MLNTGAHALASATSSTVTSAAITTQATGSGIEIVVDWSAANTFVSLLDSKLNDWIQIGSEITTSDTQCTMRRYYCANAIGGSGHTFTLTVSGGTLCSLAVTEMLTTNGNGVTLDQEGVVNDTASAFDSQSETTTQADEYLLGGFTFSGAGGTCVHTAGNSFTIIDAETDSNNFFPLMTMARIVTATGTYNTTTTVNLGVTAALCSLDTFRETSTIAVQLPIASLWPILVAG